MSSPRFITSRIFLVQLAIAVVIIIILIILTLNGLKKYTRHGQSYPVPDFAGMSLSEAMNIAAENNMKIVINDSVFIENAAPGVIVDQLPEAGHGIKQNRTIFVSVNSIQPEMVIIPQLTDISFRQARVLLENSGLQIGQIMYRPSQFTNLVLEIQNNSRILKPGQKIPKNSQIDLVIGRTQGNSSIPLPDLTGLTLAEAEEILSNSMLNTGVIFYDNTFTTSDDSLEARIWRQKPDTENISSVLLGTFIDLWVTADTLKFIEEVKETGF